MDTKKDHFIYFYDIWWLCLSFLFRHQLGFRRLENDSWNFKVALKRLLNRNEILSLFLNNLLNQSYGFIIFWNAGNWNKN